MFVSPFLRFSCLAFLMLLVSCNVNERLEVDRVLAAAESIRDGQKEFNNREKRFGSLEELAERKLIANELKDGEAYGYRFGLSAERDSYVLRVTRVETLNRPGDDGYREQLSLYLDQSGVIRASTDPKKRG